MIKKPLGAQISHMLKDRGIEMIFGIPGVHNQEMYRGIEEAGITHVLARHEQGAGFMADGYARATASPCVAFVISGPGVTNIMTPMGQAYSDSVPMLVISSCLDETDHAKGQLHQMKDQRLAAETVCEWSAQAQDADHAYWLIDKALAELSAVGRKRPIHIQIPIAMLNANAEPAPEPSGFIVTPTEVDAFQVQALANKLMNAARPVFIFGGGVVEDLRNVDLARDILDRSGAASFTTFAARGFVDPSDPLHFGSTLSRGSAQSVLDQSDCVICIATDLAEVDIWRDRLGGQGHRQVVNTDRDVLARQPAGSQLFHMDAGGFLRSLKGVLSGMDGGHQSLWTKGEVAGFCAGWRAEIDAERPGLLAVIDAVQAATPDDAMIYSDMCQIAYAAKEMWSMARPRHWHHPYGFGTLGYALPASIGGAVARAGLPTVCIIGDYGLQYTIAELGTAVELGLPLPIILWDNGKLGEIEDSMVRAQIAPNAVIQRNPDFLALARAYGAGAVEPATLADIGPVLDAAFKVRGPTVIRLTPALTS